MKLLLILNVFSQMVGTQHDEHGCSLDGGYKWCNSLSKCIRPWIDSCPINPMCKDSSMQLCRMICPHKECGKDECVKRIGSCCNFECVGLGSSLKKNDICFQYCEDNSKPFINKRYKCPTDSKCLPVDESLGFDSCGERAHKCVESN